MSLDQRTAMEDVFYNHKGRVADKWHHYLEVYERFFARFRNTPVRLLEIGVQGGGSLQIWRKYFGENAIIHGLDIDASCRAHVNRDTKIHIGDQADVSLLKSIVEDMSGVDVVIDDGGHYNAAQITSFETLYPLLSTNGVYMCEDVHTSYWAQYGGGYAPDSNTAPKSFVEYAKGLVDAMHVAYISPESRGSMTDDFARITRGVHFYDSIVVFEKALRAPPKRSIVGSVEG